MLSDVVIYQAILIPFITGIVIVRRKWCPVVLCPNVMHAAAEDGRQALEVSSAPSLLLLLLPVLASHVYDQPPVVQAQNSKASAARIKSGRCPSLRFPALVR